AGENDGRRTAVTGIEMFLKVGGEVSAVALRIGAGDADQQKGNRRQQRCSFCQPVAENCQCQSHHAVRSFWGAKSCNQRLNAAQQTTSAPPRWKTPGGGSRVRRAIRRARAASRRWCGWSSP